MARYRTARETDIHSFQTALKQGEKPGDGLLTTVGFGGGCHWCTEAVFSALSGVIRVSQGFIRSDPPLGDFSEAVEVQFDPAQVSFDSLIRVHLATHASTSAHSMRGKYRSAVYVFDDAARTAAQSILDGVSAESGVFFVTQVLAHRGFKASSEHWRDYYATDPSRPFCTTYIDPKLATLERDFAELLAQTEDATR